MESIDNGASVFTFTKKLTIVFLFKASISTCRINLHSHPRRRLWKLLGINLPDSAPALVRGCSWASAAAPSPILCAVSLPATSPQHQHHPPICDLGFLAKCLHHSNCACESALLHCSPFSTVFILQSSSGYHFSTPLPFPESQPFGVRHLPFLLLSFPCSYPGPNFSLVSKWIQFWHLKETMAREVFGGPSSLDQLQNPITPLDVACMYPSLCLPVVPIALYDFFPQGLSGCQPSPTMAAVFHIFPGSTDGHGSQHAIVTWAPRTQASGTFLFIAVLFAESLPSLPRCILALSTFQWGKDDMLVHECRAKQ